MDEEEQKSKSEPDFTINEKGEEVKTSAEPPKKDEKGSRWSRFVDWYKSDKKKSIPLTLVIFLLLLAAIPWTRYALAGTVMKKDVSLQVMDSTANTPVSEAEVRLGSVKATTDGDGKAVLKDVKVGNKTVVVSKKHYKDSKQNVLVPILKQKSVPVVRLEATGRLAKISVVDLVNGKNLEGVAVKVSDIEAETDKNGEATVVVPVGTTSTKASLSLKGYNAAEVELKVNDKTIAENVFKLTPSGKIYFLSRLSGKIDVVKTNLDGSGRQTVLAGTGREESNNTVLLASRDWKYLALLSRRDGGTPKLYLIETANDKLTLIEGGTSNISLVGWADNHFLYSVDRNEIREWEPKKIALKSYNASNKQSLILDQNEASGDSNGYIQEIFGSTYTMGNAVVYTKTWYKYGSYYSNNEVLNGKSSGLYSIRSDGTNKKTVKSFDPKETTYISSQLYEPYELYLTVGMPAGAQYYEYDGASVKSISASEVRPEEQYNTYLLSPSSNQTFWSESRDGKNTLFLGDNKGGGGKELISLSELRSYGWYTDNYLLVSKNNSELYIMPKTVTEKLQPIKITDYHKPAANFYGYGGGYGGI